MCLQPQLHEPLVLQMQGSSLQSPAETLCSFSNRTQASKCSTSCPLHNRAFRSHLSQPPPLPPTDNAHPDSTSLSVLEIHLQLLPQGLSSSTFSVLVAGPRASPSSLHRPFLPLRLTALLWPDHAGLLATAILLVEDSSRLGLLAISSLGPGTSSFLFSPRRELLFSAGRTCGQTRDCIHLYTAQEGKPDRKPREAPRLRWSPEEKSPSTGDRIAKQT